VPGGTECPDQIEFKLRPKWGASPNPTDTRAPVHPSLHACPLRHHFSSTRPPGSSPITLPAMAPDFDFESSDILGGALPVGRGRVARNSSFSSFFKICALGASTLLLLLAFRHGRTFFLRWKERHYKLYACFIFTATSFRVLPKLLFIKVYASTIRNSGQ